MLHSHLAECLTYVPCLSDTRVLRFARPRARAYGWTCCSAASRPAWTSSPMWSGACACRTPCIMLGAGPHRKGHPAAWCTLGCDYGLSFRVKGCHRFLSRAPLCHDAKACPGVAGCRLRKRLGSPVDVQSAPMCFANVSAQVDALPVRRLCTASHEASSLLLQGKPKWSSLCAHRLLEQDTGYCITCRRPANCPLVCGD